MSPFILPPGFGVFSGRESWGLRAVETRLRGSWPVDLSVRDEIWCGGVEMVWDGWLVDGYGWCGGECVKNWILLSLMLVTSHVLRMQTIAKY